MLNVDFEQLTRNCPCGVILYDREWRYLYVNPAAARILGRTRAEIEGRRVQEVFPEVMRSAIHAYQIRALRERSTLQVKEFSPLLGVWLDMTFVGMDTGLMTYLNVIDVPEYHAAEAAAVEAARRQRTFLVEMLAGLTEGRLRLCDDKTDLPAQLTPLGPPLTLALSSLRALRRQAQAAAEEVHFEDERCQDLVTAVGEAAMNAVVHAGGGEARICRDPVLHTVQVWIMDEGKGISEESLHRATLEKGYSSAGSLGHGFHMILKTCDRVFLLTGPGGTTVVLEQERQPPMPSWLQSYDPPTAGGL